MSYVIATKIDGVYHFVKPNSEEMRFELVPLKQQGDLYKAFNPPNKTDAVNVLNWIKNNDDELAVHDYTIEFQARFQR